MHKGGRDVIAFERLLQARQLRPQPAVIVVRPLNAAAAAAAAAYKETASQKTLSSPHNRHVVPT